MSDSMERNFKEKYLAGEIEFEMIDEFCFEWGEKEDPKKLAEYLGLNQEEEDVWVSDSEEALQEMLDKQKE